MEHISIHRHPKIPSIKLADPKFDSPTPAQYDFFTIHKGSFGWKVVDEKLVPVFPFFLDNGALNATRDGFIQFWLFFSVLREVFQHIPDFSLTSFVETRNRVAYINTGCLGGLINKWYEYEKSEPIHRFIRLKRAKKVLHHARKYAFKYCSVQSRGVEGHFNVVWPVDDSISFSILLLGQTLTHALQRIEHELGRDVGATQVQRNWGCSRLVLRILEQSGWDKDSIDILFSFWQHDTIGPLLSLCYGDPKLFNRRKPEKYQAYHFDRCQGNCEVKGANIEQEVFKIIKDGFIPLFRYNTIKDSVEVVSMTHTFQRDYAIFSHIYSDGFGNSDANRLNKCVLEQFHKTFSDLQDQEAKIAGGVPPHLPELFWIDSLGIPVAKGQEAIRIKAISEIHDIYKHAKYTIVLDKGLLKTRNSTTVEEDYVNLTTNIALSAWMRRVWTLQEAVLSKNIYFNFSDGLVSISTLEKCYKKLENPKHDSVPMSVRRCLDMILYTGKHRDALDVNDDVLSKSARRQFLGQVFKAMQRRTTSKIQHEALALASIFGVDTEEFAVLFGQKNTLSPEEADERMQRLIEVFGDEKNCPLHAGMIFLPGPSLSARGYRWCPKTWLTQHNAEHPDPLAQDYPSVRLIHNVGIEVKLPGFTLHEFTRSCRHFAVDDQSHPQWFAIKKVDGESWPELTALMNAEIGVISSSTQINGDNHIALLVKIIRHRKGVLTAHILTRIWICRELDPLKIQELQQKIQTDDNSTTCHGQPLKHDQTWHVDKADPTP